MKNAREDASRIYRATGVLIRRARVVGLPTVILLVYYAAFTLWFFFSGASGQFRIALADAAYLPVNAMSMVLAGTVACSKRADPRTRRGWWFITAALALQAWGDVAWFFFEGVLQTEPFPSVADIGYAGMYPFMLAGLLMLPGPKRSRTQRWTLALDAATIVAAGFMIVWAASLGSAVHEGFGSLEAALAVYYPAGDLLLILGATTAALRGSQGLRRTPTTVLLIGLAAWIVADVGFSYLSQQGDGTGGRWIDLVWVGALTCFAIAADQQRRALGQPSEAQPPQLQVIGIQVPARLPYLAILMGYVVVFQAAVNLPVYPLGGVLLGDVAVTLAVVARQLLASREHARFAASYQRAATTDKLTGLLSRQHFLDLAAHDIDHFRAEGRSVSLLVIDVDHFKQVNDGYGHLAGDKVLATVAARCREALRLGDIVCRYGGDELVALLPGANAADAALIADRMGQAVAASPVPVEQDSIPISVSIGHTTSTGDGDLSALLSLADQALYEVKRNGRGHARGYRPVEASVA